MFDLKVIHSVLDQLEEERGIPKEKIIEAIEMALATAYKKNTAEKASILGLLLILHQEILIFIRSKQ